MARQREYQGDVTANIRGGYTPFLLKRDSHLDIYQNAVNAINEQHEKALEYKGRIKDAINKIDLHERESQWKANYLNNVMQQIDNEARYGGYSSALTKATELAQSAASDPALLGRAKYYQQYKEWTKNIDNRTDIDSTIKSWAKTLHQNLYNYKDVVDTKDPTKVVGGNEFVGTREPLAKLDWREEQTKVFSTISPSKTESERSSSHYEDGSGGSSSSGSSRQAVPKEKILEGFQRWYDDHFDQIYQDWEVLNYSMKQRKDEYRMLKERNAPEDQPRIKQLEQQIKQDNVELSKVHGTDLREYSLYKLGAGSYADLMSYAWTSSKSSSASQKVNKQAATGTDPSALGEGIGRGIAAGLTGGDNEPQGNVTAPGTKQFSRVGDVSYWANQGVVSDEVY